MDYDNKYDYTPNGVNNDCEYNTPEEFASDFIVETGARNTDDFVDMPEEYENYNTESANELGYDEQAATTDNGYNDFSEAYNGQTQDNSSNNKYGENYDTETADEFTDNYDIESADDTDSLAYEYAVNNDPSDETAATVDEWYTTDCTPAQEHCKLDDYEIISDVLGSEKQIVKLYSTALCEAAEEPFRNIIRENFDEAAADQYKAFTFMQERGMYQTEQATEQKITEAKQQFVPLCENCKIGE